jgi:hypothetical protein
MLNLLCKITVQKNDDDDDAHGGTPHSLSIRMFMFEGITIQ